MSDYSSRTSQQDDFSAVREASAGERPSAATLLEIRTLDAAKLESEKQKIHDIIQDREERAKYANRIYWLVVWYLVVAGYFVFLHGLEREAFRFNDDVLMMLLGTTTASVLGLFVIVANYLFPTR